MIVPLVGLLNVRTQVCEGAHGLADALGHLVLLHGRGLAHVVLSLGWRLLKWEKESFSAFIRVSASPGALFPRDFYLAPENTTSRQTSTVWSRAIW